MRIKSIRLIALFLLCMAPMMLQAQSYEKLWKEVEKAESNGLPQTAIKYTEDIYRKAEAEQKSGQMLKAYTARSRFRQTIDPDSFYVDLKELETWAKTTTIHEDCAVLHTLIAKIYSEFAQANMYQLRRRTKVDDAPADDMREWTENIFIDKILDHTHAALEDSVLLFGLSSDLYGPFVEQHKGSRYFNHNMYHLLASYGISSLRMVSEFDTDSVVNKAIANIYSSLNRMYRAQNHSEALILVALDGLEWRNFDDGISSESYLAHLDQLIKTYGDKEICAEVYLKKARELANRNKKAAAFEVCREAIARYPKYERINVLKEVQDEILNPLLMVNMPVSVYPGDTLTLQTSHVNIDGFTAHIYKVDLPRTSLLLANTLDEKIRKNKTVKIASHHFSLIRPDDYLRRDTIHKLVSPQEGLYLIEIVPDKAGVERISQLLSVSRLKLLSRSLPDKRYEFVVFDGKTGQPVHEAAINLFVNNRGDLKLNHSVKTGENGRVEMGWNAEYRYVSVEKGADNASDLQWIRRGFYNFTDGSAEKERITLLTDRSLYRPGQTVYLKGVVYNQFSDTANVVAQASYTASLYDANDREINSKELRTNEFGSFATAFVLPQGGLNGNYSLRVNSTRTNFRVEEYKRPTFEVTLNKPEGSYKLGDEVKLKGSVKTYSGVPVQDVPVQYEIIRSAYTWWRSFGEMPTTIGSGIATVNDAGEFELPVVLTPDNGIDPDYGYYWFSVSATATNVAGESQTTTTTIAAGSRSLLLSVVEMPELINKDNDIELIFSGQNLNQQPVNVKGEYKLYPFTDYTAGKLAKEPALTGTFISNVSTSLSEWKTLPSGVYKLKLSAKDEQGREATYEAETVLFSVNDKHPAKKVGIWYYGINTSFDASQPAEFIFGTSDKDAYVLMDVFSGSKRLESRSILISDSVMHFTYPYKEEYGDGLLITFCYVKENQSYTKQVTLQKKTPDKKLKLSWSVFRDKLRPGQQEEWKLTIQNPDGTFADAELLATMYDASLNQIWKRNQSLDVYYTRNTPVVNWGVYAVNTTYYNFWFQKKPQVYPQLLFDTFRMDYGVVSLFGSASGIMVRGNSTAAHSSRAGGVASEDERVELKYIPGVVADADVQFDAVVEQAEAGRLSLSEPTADIRTNFAETAFFYPQLRTNEQGEVVIAFTLPESLTRWSFNGYAHTKGMLTGMIDSEVVTSKEFMLTPNLPRFVRVDDKTVVAASVANLTDQSVSGNVILTLFDPLTHKVITTQKQKFTANAGQTTGVSFEFTATDNYELLGCRLVAEGGNFSDGEQHVLPVLSNKERILETVVMPIRGNQTREFSLEHLFNNNSKTATGRTLTVEFSGNPAWYAVQALPSLSTPTDDNAISWATAYYANSLATYIMDTQPRLNAIFDAWKLQGGTKETFLSNLQKNQDVKNILLEESPWIMEAATEQEQKERIATLFDLNTIRNNNITAQNKLKDLQLSNGAWTWYKGMTGSRYITNYITQLLARLNVLTDQKLDNDMLFMYKAAFNFLHKEAQNEYEEILRNEKKTGNKVKGISGSALQYLYLIAISGEQVPENSKAAYAYFLNNVKDNIAVQSVTDKALAAVIMQKAGRSADAQAYLASLKEYTTQTDEQGMFFAFNENPYSWQGLKVPAHVSVMEAFDLAGSDDAAVEEMKLWLLKEKQTQQWNSPVATANAVYALLYRGTSLTESQGDVRLTLGGKVIETLTPATSSVPGLAYIKKTITDKSTLSKAKKVVVEKRDAGIAWGAVYAQYEEELNKVTPSGEGLNVEKKLYVERLAGNQKELLPVVADTQLKVGDKVVSRITIRVDRAMDFVQLKDQRAACFEPINNLSGYTYGAGTGYYVAVKDASTNFYFDSLSKGVYVLEHSYRVNRMGTYESGLAVIQSAYAPEFASHSASAKINIEK